MRRRHRDEDFFAGGEAALLGDAFGDVGDDFEVSGELDVDAIDGTEELH